jgi:hypothetical protein
MPGYGRKPGNGPGWGGPAKGAGKGGDPRPFTQESEGRVSAADTNHDPNAQATRAETQSKAWLRRQQHEAHLDRLNKIAMGEEAGTPAALNVSIAAAREFGDRVVGKPIQTNINTNVRRTPAEFTDDELAALASAGMGEEGDDEAGERPN